MELEILKLIYDYSKNGKIADEDFINKIIELIVNEKKLDKYLRNVVFLNQGIARSDGTTIAYYDYREKNIAVSLKDMKKALDDNSRITSLFKDFEQIMALNLAITRFMLHELEHANQSKRIFNSLDDSIETKLLKASTKYYKFLSNGDLMEKICFDKASEEEILAYASQINKLYREYYLYNPSERLADIISYKTILNIIRPIENNVSKLKIFERELFLSALLRGYQTLYNRITCPTETFLSGTNQNEVWSKFDFYDDDDSKLLEKASEQYSISKRFNLGLPITNEEYENTNEMVKKLII